MSHIYETILAIDPGAHGALANYDIASGKLDDSFSFSHGGWTAAAGAVRAAGTRPFAIIEKVWASPVMSVSSAFAFGCNFGGWLAFLSAHGIATRWVIPQVWQKHLLLPTLLQGHERKAMLFQRARSVPHPRVKITLDNCDAILLGNWAVAELKAGRVPGEPI